MTGTSSINWMAEIKRDTFEQNDWNKPGNLDDFFPIYRDWHFDWLDVAEMIRNADQILEYPMVDKDPVARWTLRARHALPAMPRIRCIRAARTAPRRRQSMPARWPTCWQSMAIRARHFPPTTTARREVTARIVRTNRDHPPDFINIRVEELVGDRPFENLDDYISQDELRALSDQYKQIAGFAIPDIATKSL